MGEWQADETATVEEGCDGSWCTVLLWIVPAKVDGTWKMPQGELTLKQSVPDARRHADERRQRTVPVEGKVRGEEVS